MLMRPILSRFEYCSNEDRLRIDRIKHIHRGFGSSDFQFNCPLATRLVNYGHYFYSGARFHGILCK